MIFMFLRFFMDVIQCVEVGNGFLLRPKPAKKEHFLTKFWPGIFEEILRKLYK